MKAGDILELRVEGMGAYGEGLARQAAVEFFIPKSAIGDHLKVELLEEKKQRWRAQILEILKPSPLRIPAPCKHFEICGGCDFQHLAIDEQLAWKQRISKHWLRRSPLEPFMKDIAFDVLASPNSYGYRHRVRLQVKDGKPHYFLPHSHRIFEIEECPILVPGFLEQLKAKAALLPDQKDWTQSFYEHYELDGYQFRFDSQAFTQANFPANQLLLERVKEDFEKSSSRHLAIDLYSGIGNFSLPMTRHFEKVIAVESAPSADWATQNAQANQVSNLEVHRKEAKEALELILQKKLYPAFVLMDPPRLGAWEACESLKALRSERIVYVSCALESLVRDLIQLVKKGPYHIERWTTLDLFPQTHHIESIVSLKLR